MFFLNLRLWLYIILAVVRFFFINFEGLLLYTYTFEVGIVNLTVFAFTYGFKSLTFNVIIYIQFISVTQSCPILCDPWTTAHQPPCPSSTPGVHPNPSPLSRRCHPTISSSASPSPPALNLSQHQGLFKWVKSSHQVAKVLEFQLQHQSFQWTPRTDLL